MYAQLGNIQFDGLFGFSAMSQNTAEKYAEMPRIESKSDLQHIGTELETIPLTITLHREFQEPQPIIDQLREWSNAGEILPFLDGNGKVYGQFVITTLAENILVMDTDGTKIVVTVNIELKEYFDSDKDATEAVNAKKSALALEENKPVRVSSLTTQSTPLLQTLTITAEAKNNSIDSVELVALASEAPDQKDSLLLKTKTKMASAVAGFSDALNKVEDNLIKFNNASVNFKSDLEAILVASEALRFAAENKDLTNAVLSSDLLATRIDNLNVSLLPLNTLAILRRNL